MRLVLVDGEPKTPEEATISVFDRGFLYGDSVFETIRTYGGRPYALGEHVSRLARSAERVLIRLPASEAAIASEVERAIALAQNPESYVRVMITRGTGPLNLDPSLARDPTRVVFVEPLVPPPLAAYRDGIEVALVRTARETDATPASGAKVANYLTSLLAIAKAKESGAAEAIIVDGHGRVVEGATSNVFVVKNGALTTPPEAAGILPGVTRAHLLEAAAALSIPVRLEPMTEDDLFAADEAFISSSIREVVPVVKADGRVVGAGVPGEATRKLHAEFRRRAGAPGGDPWNP